MGAEYFLRSATLRDNDGRYLVGLQKLIVEMCDFKPGEKLIVGAHPAAGVVILADRGSYKHVHYLLKLLTESYLLRQVQTPLYNNAEKDSSELPKGGGAVD